MYHYIRTDPHTAYNQLILLMFTLESLGVLPGWESGSGRVPPRRTWIPAAVAGNGNGDHLARRGLKGRCKMLQEVRGVIGKHIQEATLICK